MEDTTDIIVIGAGIAGVSAAAELAALATVRILEMEAQPGYHATGRSAAFFAPAYGNSVVRGITSASEHFYRNPPQGFTESALIHPRECLFIARHDQQRQLENMLAETPVLELVTGKEVCARVPVLSESYLMNGLRDNTGGDLDVNEILQAYLRLFRQRGGVLEKGSPVRSLRRDGGVWQVTSGNKSYTSPVVVNAAGAWADTVANHAGLAGLSIVPKRRTAIIIDAPEGMIINDWPLTLDIDEDFYFKPEAGKLLLSPADETPSEPCDAQADELDVAIAVDRFEKATCMEVTKINHRWAGLRSFAPDKSFVVGFDARTEGFFWLAGQGGYGVQSAPGLAQLTTHLVTGSEFPPSFTAVRDYINEVSPERLLG